MNFWKIAWRNLFRHGRRSLTTLLAVSFGFTGVVLLGGYMLRMDRYLATQGIYLNHTGHLSVYKKKGLDRALIDPSKHSLSPADQLAVTTAAHGLSQKVAFIGKVIVGQGLVTNGCQSFPFLATGVEPETEQRVRQHPAVQTLIPELVQLVRGHGFWKPGAPDDTIIVTHALATLLNKPMLAGDPAENLAAMDVLTTDCSNQIQKAQLAGHSGVQLLGTTFEGGLAAADARIAGHYSTGLSLSDDSGLMMPLAAAQRFFATDNVTSMAIYLGPGGLTPFAYRELRAALPADQFDVYPYFSEAVNPFYVGAMSFVYVMNLFFLILVCGVVVLSVVNALQITLIERRSEIGTLRAVGFRPRDVIALFLREIALLTAGGLITGGLAAHALSLAINHANLRFYIVGASSSLQFVLKPGWWFGLIVGAVFLLATLLVARLICRRSLRTPVASLLENT